MCADTLACTQVDLTAGDEATISDVPVQEPSVVRHPDAFVPHAADTPSDELVQFVETP